MFANLRAARAGVGLAAVMLLAGAVAAQEVKPGAKPTDKPEVKPGDKPEVRPPDSPPVVVGRPGETTLLMLVRTGPHLAPDNLKTTLQEGITAGRCQIDGEPIIRPVSPAVFEEIENLTRDIVAGDPNKRPAAGVRRLASRDLLWEIRLASPSQVMKKLTVKYKSSEGKEYDKEYAPTSPSDDSQLVLLAPGVYSFRPEPADVPVSYDAEVIALGQAPGKLDGKWPSSDRFYVITMRNFRGDRQYLFHVLQDPDMVANPLDSIRLGNDLLFVFANLDAIGADEDADVISGNNLIIGAPPPRGRRVARGWILFPLSEASLKENHEKFRKISDAKEVIKQVRENALMANDPAEINPESGPRWLELNAARNGRYQREVPMKDFKGLLEKYPTAHGLVVWEFENAQGMRSAIQMKLPGGGSTFVRPKEVTNWGNALKEKTAEPQK